MVALVENSKIAGMTEYMYEIDIDLIHMYDISENSNRWYLGTLVKESLILS